MDLGVRFIYLCEIRGYSTNENILTELFFPKLYMRVSMNPWNNKEHPGRWLDSKNDSKFEISGVENLDNDTHEWYNRSSCMKLIPLPSPFPE